MEGIQSNYILIKNLKLQKKHSSEGNISKESKKISKSSQFVDFFQ